MNFNYRELLPGEFNAFSRVWIYQASRLFTITETMRIEDKLKEFVRSWNSHGVKVKGYGNLFFEQFIILMADETASGVSGCSTDSSVHLIKEMESDFKVQLFDRQLLAFFIKDIVQLMPLSQLAFAASKGFISRDTLYFNNTVTSKTELENNWIIPVKNSWLASRFVFQEAATI
jgi:hypothetical protein